MAINLTKSFFLTIVILGAFIFFMGKLYNINFVFPYQDDKGMNIGLILLIIITILTLTGISISYNIQPSTKKILPPIGDKGERGLRGASGIKSQCGIKCSDDMCYRKVMDHISKVYNLYCKVHNKVMLGKGKHINNRFIKKKVKEICGSQIFADLIKKVGSHKLNAYGEPLNINEEKCNINKNCGAYDYIFQKWKEWILIILKYRNGKIFLDSENLNDNDFNNMIHNADLSTHNETYKKEITTENGTKKTIDVEITREWIFDTDYSIDNILDPHIDKIDEINNYFKSSLFYKFYTYKGVPDAYNTLGDDNKSMSIRKLNTKSPFDEIKMYDAWYWGANPLSTPKLVDKCVYEPIANGNNKNNTSTEIPNYHRNSNDELVEYPKLKFKLSNDYEHMWSSDKSRQLYAKNYCYTENECKDTYIPYKNKGSKPIDVYRPKTFYDNHEDSVEFKSYKPLHDVMIPKNEDVNFKKLKEKNQDCYPRLQKRSYNSYPNRYTENGPRNMTLLVSGDVKHPIDYEPVYISKREEGFHANKKAYSFWRPVAPKGYKCLGDIIDTNPYGNKPNRNLVVCIPEKCVSKITDNSEKEIWNTKDPVSERTISDANKEIDLTAGTISKIDTDHYFPVLENKDTNTRIPKNVSFTGKINTEVPEKSFNENKRVNNKPTKDGKDAPMKKFLDKYNSFRGTSQGDSNSPTGEFYKINPKCVYDKQANLKVKPTVTISKQPKNHIKYSILNIYNS